MEPVALDRLTDLDAVLTEDEILTRHTVRQFVAEKFLPTIADHFEQHTFPEHLIPEVAALGVLGASIKGYGCAGVNAVTYGLILQELEYGDSGLRSFVSVQGSLSMYAIYRFGSEAQKQHWLPHMAQGYTGTHAAQAAAAHHMHLVVVKLSEAKKGFVLLPKRWVVERSFGWAGRFRRLARDYAQLAQTLAGLHIQARQKASEAVKSAVTRAKHALPTRCPQSVSCPPRYNRHTFRVDWAQQTVNLATTQGRMPIPFTLPAYAAYAQGYPVTTADLLHRSVT